MVAAALMTPAVAHSVATTAGRGAVPMRGSAAAAAAAPRGVAYRRACVGAPAWTLHGKVALRTQLCPPPCAAGKDKELGLEDSVRLRSEAEAPFRSVRFLFFGFGVLNAAIATLTSVPQLIGAAFGGVNAMPLPDVGTNVAINVGTLVFCGFFLRRDLQARDKQMARLKREEQLGRLGVELSSGKRLQLGGLRGTCRVVIAAGTRAQVKNAIDAAEPLREELIRRGVFVVGLPIYGGDGDDAQVELPQPTKEDLRWRATPLRLDQWKEWFNGQLALASKATPEKGLFVGLRLDGRVRSSGQGLPPWQRYALELAPLSGDDQWSGFFDGFDGRVGSMD